MVLDAQAPFKVSKLLILSFLFIKKYLYALMPRRDPWLLSGSGAGRTLTYVHEAAQRQ